MNIKTTKTRRRCKKITTQEKATEEKNLEITVDSANAGLRLDRVLTELLKEKSRSFIQKLIEEGNVSFEGRILGKSNKLPEGAVLKVVLPPARRLETLAQEISLDVKYEDDFLLVINKPKGMVVHPAPGNADKTLVNALLAHCGSSLSGINGVLRPGIIHRIDKDTSGLLAVAKNDFAHLSLAQQLKDHSLAREYHAIVYGRLKNYEDKIEAPIGRNTKDRKKMCVTEKNSKPALTHYRVVEEYKNFSHVKLNLETGRTHQIRVHMAHIGHPVAGDAVYGPKKVIEYLKGQCLHAGKLEFIHPQTGGKMTVTAELPQYFEDFLRRISVNDD